MNVDINRNLKVLNNENAEEISEREQFSQLLDLMGKFGGFDPDTFEAEKEEILNSGISLDDFTQILGENMADQFGPRQIVDVDIQKLTDTAVIPTYSHESDACADIYADETTTIKPGETKLISTGIAFAIPMGYVVHIYPRSSIGVKTPLRLANSVGVIDAEYRDEVKIIYTNIGTEDYIVHQGDRIAQMSIDAAPFARFNLVADVKVIGEDRGGGFGSTGGYMKEEEMVQESSEEA